MVQFFLVTYHDSGFEIDKLCSQNQNSLGVNSHKLFTAIYRDGKLL